MITMLDATRQAAIMDAILHGGSAPTYPTGLKMRLMTTAGSRTVNGTEATSSNCPGYTAGGVTITFAANALGSSASSNTPSWTATGLWTPVVAAEIWDIAGTPLRWFMGTLATTLTGVTNGTTVSFASGFVILNGVNW
jgi:transcription elongation factor